MLLRVFHRPVAGELTRNKRSEKAKPTIFEIFASIQKLIDFLKTG
jgi:hypothetical protein